MSKVFYVARVTTEQIARLQAEPTLVLGATHIASCLEAGDNMEEILAFLEHQASRGADQPPEYARHYEALRASTTEATKLDMAPSLTLEKHWHVLHYLLTGGAAPKPLPAGALLGGDKIGNDLGYGPARLLAPEQVAEFAEYLAGQDLRQLLQRFDMRKMRSAKVYGAPDDNDAEQAALWVSVFLPKFRKFVAQARDSGDGLLLWLN
jgi:hypothetical protein